MCELTAKDRTSPSASGGTGHSLEPASWLAGWSSEERQLRQKTEPLLSWWCASPLGHRARRALVDSAGRTARCDLGSAPSMQGPVRPLSPAAVAACRKGATLEIRSTRERGMPFGHRFPNGVTQPTAGCSVDLTQRSCATPSRRQNGYQARRPRAGPTSHCHQSVAVGESRLRAGPGDGEDLSSTEAGIVDAGHELTERTV